MIDYRLDRFQGIIFINVSAGTSADEIITHIKFIFDDSYFKPDYHIIANIEMDTIIDASLPIDPEDLQNLLVDFEQKRNGSKCAIVIERETTREIVEFGLNLIEIISSDVQIFANKDDALEWIGSSTQDKRNI